MNPPITFPGDYFQKSRCFLYPLLGINKNAFIKPLNTYISWDGKIEPTDRKLICVYKDLDTEGFRQFESLMLTGNRMFAEKFSFEGYLIYVFDFEDFSKDWDLFLHGKYSWFTALAKIKIREYFGESSDQYRKQIGVYLFPERHFKVYSDYLDIPLELLKEVGELCDLYDPVRETLKFVEINLEKSEKNSLNLEN